MALGDVIDNISDKQKDIAGGVVGVGNVVAKAAGALGMGGLAEALTGKVEVKYNPLKNNELEVYEGGIKGFYNQFSGASVNPIDRIDPYNYFECSFRFFPNVEAKLDVTKLETKQTVGVFFESNTTTTQMDDIGEATKTTIDGGSVLGLLLQKANFMGGDFMINVQGNGFEEEVDTKEDDSREVFRNKNMVVSEQNIYHYVRQPLTADLLMKLGIYIQKITLPHINVEGGEDITTMIGKFPVPGNIVTPESMTFSMDIVNVEFPVAENIFYPWMRETTLPTWMYEAQPFTTATVTIDFTAHSNVKYHFYGCRPIQIQLIQPDQAPNTNPVRNVQFAFDFMTIEATDKKATEYQKRAEQKTNKAESIMIEKLANGALFSAANTLKL